MNYRNWILLTIIFLFIFSAARSQSKDECRYLAVLTYLRTNIKINDRIKSIYSKVKLAKKRERFVEFNLSERIDFLTIYDLRNALFLKGSEMNRELLNDPKLFYEKYFFESFKSNFLKNLVEPNESKLYLTFSKSIDKYLIAEILSSNPELHDKSKMGLGMKMLFIFNSNGLIEDVLISVASYN